MELKTASKCLCVAITVGLVGFVIAVKSRYEQRIEGRSLGLWLSDLDGYLSLEQVERTKLLLRARAEWVAPLLIKVLTQTNHYSFPRGVQRWLDARGVSFLAFESPEIRRRRALLGLWALGQKAAPYESLVTNLLERGEAPYFAARVLSELGQKGFEPLATAIKHTNDAVRLSAAIFLQSFPTNIEVVPLLKEALSDPSPDVRISATWSLGQLHQSAESVVPAITLGLRDTNWDVRWRSALALGKFGHEAISALPELNHLLKDSDATVRGSAAAAIRLIAPTETSGTAN